MELRLRMKATQTNLLIGARATFRTNLKKKKQCQLIRFRSQHMALTLAM
jgi:hypothetical protein